MIFELEIENQQYGNRIVFEHIRQRYASGAIHGFLGENGAGKTTLFQCMANMLPYKGKQMIPPHVRAGLLPAELFMYPMITGREFLQFYITAKELPCDEAKMNQLNNIFGLPLNEYAETYSTGMLKKLYFMGLLLQKNEVLLLDEPFNGLDFRSSAFVTALLIDCRKKGMTIFIASHNMDHLFSYSDTLSWVQNGSLLYYPDKSLFDNVRQTIHNEAIIQVEALNNTQSIKDNGTKSPFYRL